MVSKLEGLLTQFAARWGWDEPQRNAQNRYIFARGGGLPAYYPASDR